MRELNPFARTVRAAAPTGIHEPNACAMLLHFSRQQFRVLARMPDEEWPAKTGRECRRRLFHTHLRTGNFRRVAADEVIHCLGRRERTYGRQHSEGITSQEDNVGWVASDARNLGVADEFYGIRASGVFGDADISKVHQMILIEHNIFEHRPKAERLENIGLALGGEIDSFRVAAALYVEDTFVTPAMLIIAYEEAFRVSGERGFTGTAESEEKRRAPGAFVGCRRAVHREHAAFGSEIIRYGKHALFHLTRVFGTENDEFLIFQTQVNACL